MMQVTGNRGLRPTFEPLEQPAGIRVVDPIENTKLELYTDRAVSGSTGDPDDFYFPVDAALVTHVGELRIPRLTNIYFRTQDGDMVGASSNQERSHFPYDAYTIDASTGQLKLYIEVESAVTVYRENGHTVIEFDGASAVALGARSLHKQPAGTITTTDDIEDAMRAVSYLGSGLKTTSPERSFPTLRGHPPVIELGDEFSVSDGLQKPDTDVRLVLPPTFESLYPATSLAYYLGAEVVPGDTARLEAGEFTHHLDAGDSYEHEIARVLKQTFFFDCLTRTEGYYPVELHERQQAEAAVPFDLAAVYDLPLGEQLERYLSVPFEDLEPYIPDWKLTADIQPSASNVEVVPFTANELAVVRCPDRFRDTSVKPEPNELKAFYREAETFSRSTESFTRGPDPDAITRRTDGGRNTGAQKITGRNTESRNGGGAGAFRSVERSDGRSTEQTDRRPAQQNIVKPEAADSLEHTWVGDGFPIGASKATASSYRRRLDRIAGDKPYISVDIVCNDAEMSEEDVVQESYGARDFFEFDVTVHYELTKAELAEVLASKTDFLHYIGHVDENGFQCSDGMLDAWTLDEVNVEAFLLNACRSYEQGDALVQKGSLGGIVTLAKVCNDPAVRMGRALARLLNCGYPLYTGLTIARNVTLFGNQYISIGDGNLQLVKSENGGLPLAEVEEDGDAYRLTFHQIPTSILGMGSMVTPHVGENTTKYLASGYIDEFEVSRAELESFLNLETMPLLIDNDLYWSNEISFEQVL